MKSESKKIASIYCKASKALSSIAEYELAQKICERGIELFPNDPNLHSLRGNILVRIFNVAKEQKYLSEALYSFEKSLSINPNDYMSALTAAKIYIKRAAFPKAREKLDMLLDNSPRDPKATDLLNLIKVKDKVIDKPKTEKSQPLFEPFGEVDEQTTIASEDYDSLISHLHIFNKIQGIEMILLADIYGDVLKCINKARLDANRYGITISNIYRTSQNAISNTGLGTFKFGVLTSPGRHNYIVHVYNAILTIVAKQDVDHKEIEKMIHLYLAKISS